MAKRVLIKTPDRQRETAPPPEHAPARLLYSRKQARPLLGDISVATMIRLEKIGVLTPIKPNGTPTSMTFYSHGNLVAVAQARGGGHAAEG